MAYENISIPTNTFVVDSDGLFGYVESTTNSFVKKSSGGKRVFSSPLSEAPSQILDIQADDKHFYTLHYGQTTNTDRIIKKWLVDNYVCVPVTSINLYGDATHKFDSSAFSVEYYVAHTVSGVAHGDTYITVDGNVDKASPGSEVFIKNKLGYYEYLTVTGTIDNRLLLDYHVLYDYPADTELTITTSYLLFSSNNSGELYKVSPYDGKVVSTQQNPNYNGVKAATFYYAKDFKYHPSTYTLFFVNGQHLFLQDISSGDIYKSMLMDNVQTNNSTIHTVYNLAIHNGTIYRLQKSATYYGVNYNWSTYNYQMSTVREFMNAISVDAYPNILPSNGVNTAIVEAVVSTQYGEPKKFSSVHFEDDDPDGFISIAKPYTNVLGKATTTYFSGLTPRLVTITATMDQED